MALPATDAFTGSDGDTLTTYSSNWTQNRGTMNINTNACYGSSGSHDCYHWNADTFNNDQYSEIVLTALSGSADWMGVTCRADTGSGVQSFYLWDTRDTGDSYLVKYVTGSPTTIANASDGIRSVSDVLRLEVTGTTLDPLLNGSTAAMTSQTDSALSSGYAGVGGYGGSTGMRGDDWEGGDLGGAAGAGLVVNSLHRNQFRHILVR